MIATNRAAPRFIQERFDRPRRLGLICFRCTSRMLHKCILYVNTSIALVKVSFRLGLLNFSFSLEKYLFLFMKLYKLYVSCLSHYVLFYHKYEPI